MSKDPAFLWYPNDFMGGTMGMTFEEKGAYVHLLMMQFNRGHMTSHMCGHEVGQIWEKLKSKFVQDEDGLWYNKRLDAEIKKRQAYTESRRNNVKGVNQYTKKRDSESGHMDGHMTSHMCGHMENENYNNICSDYSNSVYSKFYDSEIEKSGQNENYIQVVKFLYGENDLGRPLTAVLKMRDQLSYDQFEKIWAIKARHNIIISDLLEDMENWGNPKKRTSLYRTFLTFMWNKYPNTKGK